MSRAHTSTTFAFTVDAAFADVFPLFGAERERVWAPGWDPVFLWPHAPEDRAGMVFTIAHELGPATWVNTLFDAETGEAQYVYVIADVVATVINVSARSSGPHTAVTVRYDRTSLSAKTDADVSRLARADAEAGPEWAEAINSYLARAQRTSMGDIVANPG